MAAKWSLFDHLVGGGEQRRWQREEYAVFRLMITSNVSAARPAIRGVSSLKRFQVGHDVFDLTSLKLKPRHHRVDPLR